MDRGLPKARATKLCDPQSKRNAIASSNLEREKGASLDERESVCLAS